MPDTACPGHGSSRDALARRAYDAFYAALGVPHQPWGWDHLRPVVQEAWRVVVAVVRESGEGRGDDANGV